MAATKRRFEPGPDGKYHCPVEGCEQTPYEHPQHLGLHMYHQHDIKSPNAGTRTRAARKPKEPNGDTWTAEEVCYSMLVNVTNGTIPIGAISAYEEWVAATKNFLARLP